MIKKMRTAIAICAILALIVGTTAAYAASTSTGELARSEESRKEISILSITFTGQPIADDEANLTALEDFPNYDIKLEWLLNSSYEDQLNTRMASGNLPELVVITGKTPSVISNIRAGAFWDITDEYKKYPNLAMANDQVMNNISVDGRIYGIYRARALGRNGYTYRKDWADQLGFTSIETMDDLYNFMKAAKDADLHGLGKNDTYGVTWSKWFGPLDQIAVAFGAPNNWGVKDDAIIPYFDTQEYIDAMDYCKKLYDEGLVNKDFAALETSDWVLDFRANKTAVHMDVTDEAKRSQDALTRDYGTEDNVWVMQMPSTASGKYAYPTTGHAGFVAISKSSVTTEEGLANALNFMDLCNTKIGQNILNYGVEGVHYEMNDNMEVTSFTLDPNPREGFNQFMMNVQDMLFPQVYTPLQKQHLKVQTDNIPYCVGDPCAPLTSDTYADKGSQLKQLIDDARVQYIVGELDVDGFRSVVDQWYSQGGTQICEEYTALYNELN